jgi:hypothetical protein
MGMAGWLRVLRFTPEDPAYNTALMSTKRYQRCLGGRGPIALHHRRAVEVWRYGSGAGGEDDCRRNALRSIFRRDGAAR